MKMSGYILNCNRKMHDDCDALFYFSHVCDKLVGKSADGAILKVQWQKNITVLL